ncbi:hypothetical protein B0O99DRAFT_680640 [Bisporella sp. PMI_857]|nr:hypothetical protein B0O99DRAFT_680640 [Bisporella sp. PMI_857]
MKAALIFIITAKAGVTAASIIGRDEVGLDPNPIASAVGCGSFTIDLPPPPGFNFITFCSAWLQTTVTRTSTVYATTTRTTSYTKPPSYTTKTSTRTGTASKTTLVTSTVVYPTTVILTSKTSSSKPTSTSKTSSSTSSLITTTSSTKTSSTSSVVTTTTPGAPGGSLCPSSGATGQTCGVKGWGYAENNIYYGQPIDANTCHQLCLANTNCSSFQVQDSSVSSPECNLYRVKIAPNTVIEGDSPFIFYDRDCPDYSPPSCKREAGTLVRKDASIDIPDFLIGLDPIELELLCLCLVPHPPDPTTTYVTTTSRVTATSTVTVGGETQTTTVFVDVSITNTVSRTTTRGVTSTSTEIITITV